jgi:hypothetical protein
MKQFLLTSRARHIRSIYFIDEKYDYEKLLRIILLNQSLWGGRFNPIIPVVNNVISERYLAILKHYDADYIYYSKDVNPDMIKELRLFNPIGYLDLAEIGRIPGLDSFQLISLIDNTSKIAVLPDDWGTNNPLYVFYKLNFGLESSSLFAENEIEKNFSKVAVPDKDIHKLNKILHTEKPIDKSYLSRLNVNTRILRNLEFTKNDEVEIIIAKDKTNTSDLLYYWNRMLFEARNILYITVDELNMFTGDKYFGGVIYDLTFSNRVSVVSLSLDKEEIEKIIKEILEPIALRTSYRYKDISSFPFSILDANGLFSSDFGEEIKTQTLISEKGLFYLPKLSFTNKTDFYPQNWIVDVEIEKTDFMFEKFVLFPYTAHTQTIIGGVDGRINRTRNISLLINSQQKRFDNLNIDIPNLDNLFRQLIYRPMIDGISKKTKFVNVRKHDPSNRLQAFIKLFDNSFFTIKEFFTDKFWVDIFEQLIQSESATGDTIHFDDIFEKAQLVLKENGVALGKRENTYLNSENLIMGLKNTLDELCGYRVFLKGFSLKCNNCSSQFWYHLTDINETINCKGCLEDFELPIEPKFSYKLNDLIKNNIFQTRTSRDGNLTVIRTLEYLYNQSNLSFEYIPQTNLYIAQNTNKPHTDLDIICTSNGKLIIGEAKHTSTAFFEDNNKSLKSLVEIALEIRPDTIILSCYENPNGKLENAVKSLIHIFNKAKYTPNIETLHLSAPDYHNLNSARYFPQ